MVIEKSLVGSKTIKPSKITPSHLKHYNLSSQDKLTPGSYIPFVFFYPNSGNVTPKIAENLKCSLSNTLSTYYPFAGRLKSSQTYIDCNDEGVEFLEIRIQSCSLKNFLLEPEHNTMDLVFPPGLVWGKLNDDSSLFVVQLTQFECGGLAIAVCMSHKLGDACTLCNFMNYWAAITLGSGDELHPHFVSSQTSDKVMVPEIGMKKGGITRKFVFSNTKLATLKAMAVDEGVENPTRVEVVTALLYKTAFGAAMSNLGSFIKSVLFQSVNMRRNMNPPLPETSVGNFYWRYDVEIRDENDAKFLAMIEKIKRGKMEIKGMKVLDGNEYWSTTLDYIRGKYKIYLCSSLCNFPFYEVDFGWGKPSKVTLGDTPSKNNFYLMDTPNGDGIEAMVSLDEEDMIIVQQDKEILAFASLF